MALTSQFRATHDALREKTADLRLAAERFPELSAVEREETVARLLRHLRERVEPHTRLDEQVLYPQVVTRLGDPLVTASMSYDHLAIRQWIEEIAAADLADTARLQRLLYGLDALIRVHIWKEDELFLAALDSPSWPNG
jgi:hemerythrin HHE cation binding domain-containing protein